MDSQPEGAPRLVLIAGYRHAGKSLLLRQLEEAGWTCVDNLPPRLVQGYLAPPRGRRAGARIAIALDVEEEEGAAAAAVEALRSALAAGGRPCRLVFLAASESALREREAAAGGGAESESEASARRERERARLAPIVEAADLLIDSSWTAPIEERDRVIALAEGRPRGGDTIVEVSSFGFKFGPPAGDLVVDLRFLPNPYYVAELRHLTGRDGPCAEYVLSREGAPELLEGLARVAAAMAPAYGRQGRHRLRVRLGCTGGRHRSVAMAEALRERLEAEGIACVVRHRELGGE